MDSLTTAQRQKNMRHIKSKDTKAEIVLRRALWVKGYRYRKNYKELPGKPDIVLAKYHICIFIDSEFFHGKDYDTGFKSTKYRSLSEKIEHGNRPDYWKSKIRRNMERDRENNAELFGLGWHVIRFWSHDALRETDQCIKTIEEAILSRKLENRD